MVDCMFHLKNILINDNEMLIKSTSIYSLTDRWLHILYPYVQLALEKPITTCLYCYKKQNVRNDVDFPTFNIGLTRKDNSLNVDWLVVKQTQMNDMDALKIEERLAESCVWWGVAQTYLTSLCNVSF